MANTSENEMEYLISSSSDENESKQNKETSDNKEKYHLIFDMEPLMLVYTLYFGATVLFAEQYIYKSISQKKNLTDDANFSYCENHSMSNMQEDLQEMIQKESSYVMLILTVCTTVPSMISTLFIGPYCDRFGRKIGLGLPLIGAIFKCTVYAIVIFVEINYWFMLIGSIIEGFTGYLATFYMAAFAYSSDVSSLEKRTRKVTVVEVTYFFAGAFGQMATGPIINKIGYTYPFIFLALILTLGLVFVIVILPETIIKSPYKNQKSLLGNLCSIENIHICAKTIWINTKSNRRPKLLLNLAIVTLMVPMTLAKWDAQTYFLKGKPLCFTSYQVGYFSGGMTLLQGMGNMGIVFCCAHKIGDLWILVIGLISGLLHMILFAFVTTIQLLALVPILGIFATIVMTMVRSICSKLVDTNEQGSMFSAIALAEATGHMLGVSVFNSVFSASVNIMPGFVFLVMAATYIIAIILALSQKCIPEKV